MTQQLDRKFPDKKTIVVSVLGLGLTIASIIIYTNCKEIIELKLVLIAANLSFGFFQFYVIYFKDKDFGVLGKCLLSIMSCFLFVIVVFVILLLLNSFVFKAELLVDYEFLLYSVFLLPSFIFVVALMFLLISSLGYS